MIEGSSIQDMKLSEPVSFYIIPNYTTFALLEKSLRKYCSNQLLGFAGSAGEEYFTYCNNPVSNDTHSDREYTLRGYSQHCKSHTLAHRDHRTMILDYRLLAYRFQSLEWQRLKHYKYPHH